MPRGSNKGARAARARRNACLPVKRGRKPIFTDEQKRVLERLVREALKEQLRGLVKSL